MMTPWGKADNVILLPHGIKSISTPSHGGFWVPAEARKLMPPVALTTYAGTGWYEEDSDWSLVALAFPEILDELCTPFCRPKEEVLESARETVRFWHSPAVCAAFGLTPAPDSHYREK